MENFYDILRVNIDATPEEIKKSFKKLAKQYHPDAGSSAVSSDNQFKLINEAYQVLSDPQKKLAYDQQLLYPQLNRENTYTSSFENTKKPPSNAWKINLFAGLALLVFIVLSVFFFQYMEKYTSEELLKKATESYRKGKTYQATLELEEALEKNEDNPGANYLMGRILLDNDKAKSAIFYFSQAIALAEQLPAYYLLARGEAYERNSEPFMAEADYQLALIQDQENKFALMKLADLALYTKRNYQEAYQFFELATKFDSTRFEATQGMAIAQQKLGEYSTAFKLLTQLHEQRPDEGITMYYIGFHYLSAEGDTLKACGWWKDAAVNGVKEAKTVLMKFCNE